MCTWPIVICFIVNSPGLTGSAVVTITTVSTIKPDFINLPVFCQELAKLVTVVTQVLRSSVYGTVPVPWRQVYTQLQAVFIARIPQLTQNIAFPVLPDRILN